MGSLGSKVSELGSKLPFISKKKDPSKTELQIISRAEWRARVPRWREDLTYPALSAACVYTGTKHCTDRLECVRAVQEIQNTHMDRDGLPDIEFSFLVGGDGSVFEGRGWHTISNRNVTINCVDPERPPLPQVRREATEEEKMSPERRIVIAYIGDPEVSLATEEMEKVATKLVQLGVNSYYLDVGKLMPDDEYNHLDDALKEIEELEAQGDAYGEDEDFD